jgi:4-aminobutyrate aminotransferase-like enzyme
MMPARELQELRSRHPDAGQGDLLVMFPALTIDEATIDAALDILEGALVA